MHLENHFAPIAALDLDSIKVKLMHEESGEGWSLPHADAVEFEYRRFLYLMKKFPNDQVAPLIDVDTFWHYHILDTMKYAADCDAVFGYFLHHFPYVGLRGSEDLEVHQRSGARMRELYEHTYGGDYVRLPEAAHSLSVAANADNAALWQRVPTEAWCQGLMKAAWSSNVPPISPSATVAPPLRELSVRSPAAMFNSARPTISPEA